MNSDETCYKIIGCAMKVHNTLGPGFQEVIYQRCLALELSKAELSFSREEEHPIFYDDIQVGARRANFIIEEDLIVEIKAINELEDVHIVQFKKLYCSIRQEARSAY